MAFHSPTDGKLLHTTCQSRILLVSGNQHVCNDTEYQLLALPIVLHMPLGSYMLHCNVLLLRICQRGNLRFDRQQNKRTILPQCEIDLSIGQIGVRPGSKTGSRLSRICQFGNSFLDQLRKQPLSEQDLPASQFTFRPATKQETDFTPVRAPRINLFCRSMSM